jgi:hypothetical protein
MNERIRELAEQAGMIIGDTSKFDMAAVMPKEVKFAELIVRECAAEAHRRVCIDGNDNMIYSNLLAHFGVEE